MNKFIIPIIIAVIIAAGTVGFIAFQKPSISLLNTKPKTSAPIAISATTIPENTQPIQALPVSDSHPSVLDTPAAPAAKSKTSQSKRSAFALLSLSNAQNVNQINALLDNASIDGVAIQIGWTSMETADGVFNWTTLDTALKTAKDRGKGVTLHIFSSGPFGISPWLKAVGVKTYTFVDFQEKTHEEALPWDQTFLSQYSQFLKSLAAHLSSENYASTVVRISVGVPVPEMDLIACRNNMLASEYSYDRAVYLDSWKTIIDAHASAFPSLKKFVSAPVGLICFPDHDTRFFADLMEYAFKKYGATFVPFAADLTSAGSDRMKSYTSIVASRGLGYQPIGPSTNDSSNRMKSPYPGSLLQATCKAAADGADYVEIYAADVLNADSTIQKGIKAVHDTTLCK